MNNEELENRVKALELELIEEKRVTQCLREGEAEFQSIADNITAHIAYVNADTLKYEFVNNLFEKSFGITRDKIIGSHIKVVIGEKNYEFALKYIKVVKSGKTISYENTFDLSSGKRWIQVNYSPVFDANSKVVGIAVVSYDITERILAEQKLEESEKQLLQLNSDKDIFLSILGHDLRSPFNTLLGFSKLLLKNIRIYDIDKIEYFAKTINKSARTANNLLEDILIWARAQQGSIPFKPLGLNLADIYNDVHETLKPIADAKNIVINCLAEDHLNVFADADMLKTLLRNLVLNAIKFTNYGGAININAAVNFGVVTISVSDNGVGIPPKNRAKLFDISEVLTTTGTAKETGTGLGLLLCNEFVEKHGGKIWVESEVGKGSDFKFTLPSNADHNQS